MRVFALQTARAGSKSVVNKNIMSVAGIPLFMHNVNAALSSNRIEGVYVSTDSKYIIDYDAANKSTYEVIVRPDILCTDDASHLQAIRHGLAQIEQREGCIVDILVILLGNSNGATGHDLDDAIDRLMLNDEADSVQSVSAFNMFNPYRCFVENNNNFLTTLLAGKEISSTAKKQPNDKDAFGDMLFFNGSFWVCRRAAIMDPGGKEPFPWLGTNILPHRQEPCMELDAEWQRRWFQ